MKMMKIQLLALLLAVTLAGCVHPFWNPAGAKYVPYEDFSTLYYMTDPERTKAYVFFSQDKLLFVGMSLSTKWDKEAEKYAISFGGVRRTRRNQEKWGQALRARPYGTIWFMDMDIGVGTHGKPEDKFKMYYTTNEGVWGQELPFHGTITEKELQNQPSHRTAESRADAASIGR